MKLLIVLTCISLASCLRTVVQQCSSDKPHVLQNPCPSSYAPEWNIRYNTLGNTYSTAWLCAFGKVLPFHKWHTMVKSCSPNVTIDCVDPAGGALICRCWYVHDGHQTASFRDILVVLNKRTIHNV
uniref:ORF8 protein n=1 Tax=Severe acute respiratory syndrome coronavirus TaxID=694009 RepID=A0A7R7AJ64_SARS|nr:ORF8 protein [Severe acute respiratory syndrome-related coronavirus]